MIDIKTLEPDDQGRWVYYTDFDGRKELGRVKGHSDSSIFVVFKCNDLWVDYLNYPGQGCNPNDLSWKHENGHDKQTVTMFRKFSDKSVIALFLEIPGKQNSWYDCLAYMHVGQHGCAHVPTIMETTEIVKTYYGYRDLMAELLSIGYNVAVTDTLKAEYSKSRRKENDKWQRHNMKV